MITIVTVLFRPARIMATTKNTAVYTPQWADKLYRGFKRNVTHPFRFVCITDQTGFREDIEAIPFTYEKHVGTWMCINEIFRPDLGIDRGLFCGLDTIVCKNVDPLTRYYGDFCMVQHPRNPDGRLNPITLFSNAGWIWDEYMRSPEEAVESSKTTSWSKHQGSEMIWWSQINPDSDVIGDVWPEGKIYSYQMDHASLQDADIVYFHGEWKPGIVDHKIIRTHWV